MTVQSRTVDDDNTDLPMPTPTIPNRPLTSFKTLSFDIYETLIQWESSIIRHFSPLLVHLGHDSPYKNAATDPTARQALSDLFAKHEKNLQSVWPKTSYTVILERAYIETANEILSDLDSDSDPKMVPSINPDLPNLEVETRANNFGQSVGTWPPFPDTLSAMEKLSRYYRLTALSNVDRQSFSQTLSGPLADTVSFWRIFTAQDVGSYKPCHENFKHLFQNLERTMTIEKDQGGGDDGGGDGDEAKGPLCTSASTSRFDNLHVAQSLYHDHVPCKALGVPSVWINRSGAGTGRADFKSLHEKGRVGYGWRFNTLAEFADEVDRQHKAL
ncbi:hypothetical protein LTS17_005900 [Exophiala oligosperma]